MRAALAFALQRSAARLVFGVGILGVIWAALYRTWPWGLSRTMLWSRNVHVLPTTSSWDLPVAAAVLVLALALSVLIFRRRSPSC